ncbi:Dyp-type peroxidase [Nocardia mangyaensis]|uniref:Dyp-type peroxidase n=1 Tax=Nocardia mangyaensis TaxID=2213200 RepID=UPI002674EF86|nr:Dyp-type peroxidase [Nocardia mangyaensis]MDO3649763.1 Dyp-type peroxidase [Nocardia mangyaensis]
MGEPQPVLDPLTPAAIFLVATIDEGGEAAVRQLLGEVDELRKSVGFRAPGQGLSCVTSIGSSGWDRLFAGPRPAELHVFPGYRGAVHSAPTTPGDLLFHIRSETTGTCYELAMAIATRLRGAVTFVDETSGFRYFEQRDLLGFVDGTANPEGAAAAASVFVGEEDADFAGGSYVIVQKYVHPLDQWNALPVEEQERVIGRTKLSDYELPDDVKPPNSHVTINTIIDPDGTERDVLRANMPFGTVGDGQLGTYYIAYCATPSVTERMLERMFLGTDDAAYDRILDFSTAITGTLFFTPAADFFDDLPDAPAGAEDGPQVTVPEFEPVIEANAAAAKAAATTTATGRTGAVSDGSLAIGTMKRSIR